MPKSKKKRSQENKVETKARAADQQRRDVDLVLECDGAEHVYVCGDFDDWQSTSLRMIGNPDASLWEKRLVLAPGRYEYKFIVDGEWIHDDRACNHVPNAQGSLNSVVEVKL